jgi:hypothetical protein
MSYSSAELERMAHSLSLHFCGALGIQSFQDPDVLGFNNLVLQSSKDVGAFNGIKCFDVVFEDHIKW